MLFPLPEGPIKATYSFRNIERLIPFNTLITFQNKKVGDFFNNNFINISIDAEKGIGPQVSRYFGVNAYPTLVFTDAAGKPVMYALGYMGTKDILKFAQAALDKLNSQK